MHVDVHARRAGRSLAGYTSVLLRVRDSLPICTSDFPSGVTTTHVRTEHQPLTPTLSHRSTPPHPPDHAMREAARPFAVPPLDGSRSSTRSSLRATSVHNRPERQLRSLPTLGPVCRPGTAPPMLGALGHHALGGTPPPQLLPSLYAGGGRGAAARILSSRCTRPPPSPPPRPHQISRIRSLDLNPGSRQRAGSAGARQPGSQQPGSQAARQQAAGSKPASRQQASQQAASQPAEALGLGPRTLDRHQQASQLKPTAAHLPKPPSPSTAHTCPQPPRPARLTAAVQGPGSSTPTAARGDMELPRVSSSRRRAAP